MLRFQKLSAILCLAALFTACKKDKDPVIIIPPSSGSQLQLNGGTGGASAKNSIFVDFSADKQDSVARASWDLGFYSGSQFRVKINNTNGASAISVDKTDINVVSISDINTDDLQIALGDASAYAIIDDPVTADINKTVIAEVSAIDADNKVYVINPAGGSHSVTFDPAKLVKVRILRKSGGYTLQYAKLSETTYKTLDITKNTDFNFQYVSLPGGTEVTVEPTKNKWEIQWTWSMYYMAGATPVPYSFSDLVFINTLGGVTAAEVLTSTISYDAYAAANIATTTFSSNYDVIGSNWRATTGTIGVKTDRFYVVKDASGNVYKLKFLNFHASDGGERGKPRIEYKLVQ